MNDFCPKCNADLRGKDIYQHFLSEYTEKGISYPKSLAEILSIIKDYPELYPADSTPTKDQLEKMSHVELNAWYTANKYGWNFTNPKTFNKIIGIEIPGVYDGVIVWKCPECQHKWKRFDWVDDKYLV